MPHEHWSSLIHKHPDMLKLLRDTVDSWLKDAAWVWGGQSYWTCKPRPTGPWNRKAVYRILKCLQSQLCLPYQLPRFALSVLPDRKLQANRAKIRRNRAATTSIDAMLPGAIHEQQNPGNVLLVYGILILLSSLTDEFLMHVGQKNSEKLLLSFRKSHHLHSSP